MPAGIVYGTIGYIYFYGMSIAEIYDTYKIMPSLQLHMRRVAAVSKVICDNMQVAVPSEDIIRAMLLHDIGNIIKFKLTRFPQFLEPEGIAYWQEIQEEFQKKYGNDEHMAVSAIAKELAVSENVSEILHRVGFSKAKENFLSGNIIYMIACYADMRVTPYSIVDLETRMQEGRARYRENKHVETDEYFDEGIQYLRRIEKVIFEHASVSPADITEVKVDAILRSGYLETLAIS